MARRPDGSYEHGDWDSQNPKFHFQQAEQRRQQEQTTQSARSLKSNLGQINANTPALSVSNRDQESTPTIVILLLSLVISSICLSGWYFYYRVVEIPRHELELSRREALFDQRMFEGGPATVRQLMPELLADKAEMLKLKIRAYMHCDRILADSRHIDGVKFDECRSHFHSVWGPGDPNSASWYPDNKRYQIDCSMTSQSCKVE